MRSSPLPEFLPSSAWSPSRRLCIASLRGDLLGAAAAHERGGGRVASRHGRDDQYNCDERQRGRSRRDHAAGASGTSFLQPHRRPRIGQSAGHQRFALSLPSLCSLSSLRVVADLAARTSGYHVGDVLDVRDTQLKWLEGRIVAVDPRRGYHINFVGWSERWNEWMPKNSDRLAASEQRRDDIAARFMQVVLQVHASRCI